jgi:hypothetical protein
MEGSEGRRVAIAVAHASFVPESARQYKMDPLRVSDVFWIVGTVSSQRSLKSSIRILR